MNPDRRVGIRREEDRDEVRRWENSRTMAGVVFGGLTLLAISVMALATQKNPDSNKSKPIHTPEPTAQIYVIPEAPSLSTDTTIQIPLTATLEYRPR